VPAAGESLMLTTTHLLVVALAGLIAGSPSSTAGWAATQGTRIVDRGHSGRVRWTLPRNGGGQNAAAPCACGEGQLEREVGDQAYCAERGQTQRLASYLGLGSPTVAPIEAQRQACRVRTAGMNALDVWRPSHAAILKRTKRPVAFRWWAREVLNLRPLACEASALPLSYAPFLLRILPRPQCRPPG
jgi:hypothetical protein